MKKRKIIIWVIVLLIFLFWFFELPKRASPYVSYNSYESFVKIVSKEPNMELYPIELLPESYRYIGNEVRTHNRSSIRPFVFPEEYQISFGSKNNSISIRCSDHRRYGGAPDASFTANNIKVEIFYLNHLDYDKVVYQFYYNGFYYSLSSQEDIPQVKEIVSAWLNTM